VRRRTNGDIPVVRRLRDLASLVEMRGPDLYVRYSEGPDKDAEHRSVDYESGAELPGLSVNPLSPEPWWNRPVEDWLARQLCTYVHLRDGDDGRLGWVLAGTVVARGPDNEPLVEMEEVVALLGNELIEEAKARYHERFDVGRESVDTGSNGNAAR
jgi:hypothetical protein